MQKILLNLNLNFLKIMLRNFASRRRCLTLAFNKRKI